MTGTPLIVGLPKKCWLEAKKKIQNVTTYAYPKIIISKNQK